MIDIVDLNFSYDKDNEIFKGINLSIDEGLTSIVGPNAAGKSTMLKCIFGLLDYDGSINYNSKEFRDYKREDLNNLLVYLPQEEGSTPRITVLETVLLGRLGNLGWKVDDNEVEEIMDILRMLDIDKLSSEYLTQLSGGQRQIVYIAQTLAKDPDIILMDEPTNNLDIQRQLEFCQLLRLLLERKDMTIIVVLHDLNLAIQYSDNIIVLDGRGGVYDFGKPEDVITSKMLKDVYNIEADIILDKEGNPIVVSKKSIREINLYQK